MDNFITACKENIYLENSNLKLTFECYISNLTYFLTLNMIEANFFI